MMFEKQVGEALMSRIYHPNKNIDGRMILNGQLHITSLQPTLHHEAKYSNICSGGNCCSPSQLGGISISRPEVWLNICDFITILNDFFISKTGGEHIGKTYIGYTLSSQI